jgi:hypothetical protein
VIPSGYPLQIGEYRNINTRVLLSLGRGYHQAGFITQ